MFLGTCIAFLGEGKSVQHMQHRGFDCKDDTPKATRALRFQLDAWTVRSTGDSTVRWEHFINMKNVPLKIYEDSSFSLT